MNTLKPIMVNWDRPMLKRFKRKYEKVKDNPDEVFKFEGNEYVSAYAKHLINFLEITLPVTQ